MIGINSLATSIRIIDMKGPSPNTHLVCTNAGCDVIEEQFECDIGNTTNGSISIKLAKYGPLVFTYTNHLWTEFLVLKPPLTDCYLKFSTFSTMIDTSVIFNIFTEG